METNTEILYTESKAKLKYTGKVVVAIEDSNGNRVTVSKFHNQATQRMFDFFAHCLAGEYKAAEANRPCMLGLFTRSSNASGKDDVWTSKELMSSFVHFDRAHVNFEDDKTTTTLHFRVPFIYLKEGQVTRLALYPARIVDVYSSICAKYWLDPDKVIEIPLSAGNFTIVVDWTLELATDNTTTNNSTTSSGTTDNSGENNGIGE